MTHSLMSSFVRVLHFLLIILFFFLFPIMAFSQGFRSLAAIFAIIIIIQPWITGSCLFTDVEYYFDRKARATLDKDVFFNRFVKNNFGWSFRVNNSQEFIGKIVFLLIAVFFLIFGK